MCILLEGKEIKEILKLEAFWLLCTGMEMNIWLVPSSPDLKFKLHLGQTSSMETRLTLADF